VAEEIADAADVAAEPKVRMRQAQPVLKLPPAPQPQ
jgi:hypothetical protein